MKRLGLAAVLCLTSVHASAQNAEVGKIQRFLRDRVPVFNEGGTEIQRMDGRSIKVPLAVVGFNDLGYLKANVNGSIVYFRRADVTFDGPPPCTLSPELQRSNVANAGGTPGMRAGAGSSGRACIPGKP